MKDKHLATCITICRAIAEQSACERRQFGALVFDEASSVIVATGYNGYLRGGPSKCGGDKCFRKTQRLRSGHELEVGCIHAEMNALINCARQSVSTVGKSLIVSGDPCMICTKLIVQAGITRVYFIDNVYPSNSLSLLREMGVVAVPSHEI